MSQVNELFVVAKVSKSVFSPLNFSYLSRHNLAEELPLPFQTRVIVFLTLSYFWFLNGKFLTEFHFFLSFLKLFTKYVTVSRKLLWKFCSIKCIAFCDLRNKHILKCDDYRQVTLYHKSTFFFFCTFLLQYHCTHYILPNKAIILEQILYS